MIHIAPIYDDSLIKNTMLAKSIFKHVKDDSTPEDYDPFPATDGYMIYLGVYDDDKYLGLFNFIRKNGIAFEGHICLLPSAFGKAREAGVKTIEWMFSQDNCLKLIAEIPETNIQAKKMLSDLGFDLFGINKNAIQKNGKLLDLYCYSLSKG